MEGGEGCCSEGTSTRKQQPAMEVELQRLEETSSQGYLGGGCLRGEKATAKVPSQLGEIRQQLTKEESRHFNSVFTCTLWVKTLTDGFMPVSLAKDTERAVGRGGDSEMNTSLSVEIETDHAIHKNRSLRRFLKLCISFCLQESGETFRHGDKFHFQGFKNETVAAFSVGGGWLSPL